ncbi:hypothetical protein [Streptomyces sp. NPDC050264]|uniref:hypothetical protein n=1 Tax=Streptomyces sp. NPDC050264 TaxID=3155038 RepID=UPI00343B06D8
MRFLLLHTEPVQEVAAEPSTLAALTSALRTVPVHEPGPGQLGALVGIGLVPDPAIPPGTLHLRPRKATP